MSIQHVSIPYPDFKLQEIIEPDQFDLNNAKLQDKINEILSILNQITDSINDGGSGADAISLTSIAPFASTKLQSYLEEVVNRLRSTTDNASGADLIGATAISGVVGTTVQSQLESLKATLNGVSSHADANTSDINVLQSRTDSLESRTTNVENRATSVEGRTTTLENAQTNLSNNFTTHKSSADHDYRYYTEVEVDNLLSNLKGTGYSSETLSGLQAKYSDLQTQINNLNNTYSTDAERIQSINDVINQFQIADSDLNTLIQNKANKSDVYTKSEMDTRQWGTANLTSRSVTSDKIALSGVKNENIEPSTITSDKLHPSVAQMASDATLAQKVADSNRITATLVHGTSVIDAPYNSPVDFEIQGRTLINNSMSNLLPSSYYVVADKKLKVKAEGKEGTQLTGVTKFQKSNSVLTKADFTNKVSGSVTENAHITKYSAGTSTTLQVPTSVNFAEINTNDYGKINSLNGINISPSSSVNGHISQTIFSFNIIEQIERKLGRIPSDTVSGKVQWIKDNVNRLTCNWHGFGSSVGGNGASFTGWNALSNAWSIYPATTTNGTITKLNWNYSPTQIDSNGFVHMLAYTTNASDGTTASQISTDFVECEVELKTSAVLDTRPIITRVANFEGKVSASTVENPHTAKRGKSPSLLTPNGSWTDFDQSKYTEVQSLNGLTASQGSGVSGDISQEIFSFDLIQEVERNLGRIPKSTTADKVQWLKDNVERISVEWNGFGSSVGGNKAFLTRWISVSGGQWESGSGTATHTSNSVSKLSLSSASSISVLIQSDGFIHYLAYAEASDGTTASTINTDYVEISLSLKQGATLFEPVAPIYEVDSTDYAKILVDWAESDVLTRFPKIQGVQHLQNVAVIAEGENLIPNFYEAPSIMANAKVLGSYELEHNATAVNEGSTLAIINALPNQQYTMKADTVIGKFRVWTQDVNGANIAVKDITSATSLTFTTESNCAKLAVYFLSTGVGKFTLKNPMLNLGSTAKPFVPRNPSYLFAQTKLGQIGTVKDTFFKSDGQYLKRKLIEKDVSLDGTLAWTNQTDYVGFKSSQVALTSATGKITNTVLDTVNGQSLIATKYNGEKIKYDNVGNTSNLIQWHSSGNYVYISVSDTETGFGESYVPTNADWQRYFNGWKYSDGVTWTSLTGNGQTATASVALSTKPTDYTPYKLSYVLATPQTLNLSNVVEGDIAVSGSTQVEVTSGVIVREKVTPRLVGTSYALNYDVMDTKLKPSKALSFYKNTIKDTKWSVLTSSRGIGGFYFSLSQADYDSTAEYTVTYLVLDRHLFTCNGTEVRGTYNGSLKDVVDTLVERQADLIVESDRLQYGVDYVQAMATNNRIDLGTKTSLLTTDKSSLVSAVNELFTSANSVKSNVSSAIGSPATASDTGSQLAGHINTSKSTLATNLTNKGVSATNTETLSALAGKVANISRGQGNAVEANVLSGVTFSNSDGALRTGTMPNITSDKVSPSITGTGNGRVYTRPPQGYWNGSLGCYTDEPNLIASNVKNGVSIFGVTGTFNGDYYNGTGNVTLSTGQYTTITLNLAFTPSRFHAFQNDYGKADLTWLSGNTNGMPRADTTASYGFRNLTINGGTVTFEIFNETGIASATTIKWYATITK